jgi:hypothetical protein
MRRASFFNISTFGRHAAERVLAGGASALLASAILFASPSTVSASPSNLRRQAWQSANVGVIDGSGLAQSPALVFAQTGDAVVAFSKSDGSTVWTSPTLADSGPNGSTSTPLYVAATNRVAIGTGSNAFMGPSVDAVLYILDANDGLIDESATFVGEDIVNGSPAYANGLYYIKTHVGFGSASGKLYAIRETDGGVEWFAADGGNGGSTPIVEGGLVYDLVFVAGSHEVRAYDAATGAVQWTSAVGTIPFIDPYGGIVLSGGAIYYSTNDFFDADPLNPSSELISIDATDGSLNWRVPAAGTSGTPAVDGGLVYANGAFSYGQATARSVVDGSVSWSRAEGYWNTSPVVDNGRLLYCGDPAGGLGAGPNLLLLDAATGDYIDSLHRPYVSGTPLVDVATVYVAGGGVVRALAEASTDLLWIEEAFVGSAAQDYLVIGNRGVAPVDLTGWTINVHMGDGLGYALEATLPAHSLLAGETVRVGAETHVASGLDPDLVLGTFDLPDLLGGDTVKSVRLSNPQGETIDTLSYVDGAASGEMPALYASDDTGEANAARAFPAVASNQALRRVVGPDTNVAANDFATVDFPTAVANWGLYE